MQGLFQGNIFDYKVGCSSHKWVIVPESIRRTEPKSRKNHKIIMTDHGFPLT